MANLCGSGSFRDRSRSTSFRRAQQGAILPLLVVMLIPLLALIGLAIDTAMVLSAKNALNLTAQNAALAALSKYIAENPALGPSAAVTEARDRAQQIANLNDKHAVHHHGGTGPLGKTLVSNRLTNPNDPINTFYANVPATSLPHNREGTVEIGKYYFNDIDHEFDGKCVASGSQPSYCSTRACDTDPTQIEAYDCKPCSAPVGSGGLGLTAGKSCFVQKASGSTQNTAVRFTAQVSSNNKLRTMFLGLIGINNTQFRVQAIATLIPRNDVFLLDLSRSMYKDTHLTQGYFAAYNPPTCDASTPGPAGPCTPSKYAMPTDPEPNSRSEFVYVADQSLYGLVASGTTAAFACGGVTNCDVDDPTFNVPPKADDLNTPQNEATSTGDQASWDQLYISPGAATPPHPYYRHFSSHYYFWRVPFSNVDPVSGLPLATYPTKFFINSMVPPAVPSAEPLFSMLNAVHGGMDILAARGLGSDSLAIYGFDSQGPSPVGEGIEVSASPRAMDPVVPNLSNSQFLNFYNNTDLSTAPRGFIPLGMFPIPRFYSDLGGALAKGLSKVSLNKTYTIAKNSIFMFTDGMANCPHEVNNSGPNVEFPLVYGPTTVPPGAGCSHNGKYVIESIDRLIADDFVEEFKKRNVSISIALVGDNVRPHFIARASGGHYGCINQTEAAKNQEENFYVNSGTDDGTCVFTAHPDGTGTTCPNNPGWHEHTDPARTDQQKTIDLRSDLYRAPNELYRLVRDTKGLWIPIMKPAYDPMAPTVPLDFEEELEAKCDSVKPTSTATSAIVCSGGNQTDYILRDCTYNGVRIIDSYGRVLFDPKGRTVGEQMSDAMASVLSSPFMLVD